jgi:hypothetical protein
VDVQSGDIAVRLPCVIPVERPMWLRCRQFPCQTFFYSLGIWMEDGGSLLKNDCLQLFLMESHRQYRVNRSYKTTDVNGNVCFVKTVALLSHSAPVIPSP